jgi:hypothetical protein
MGLFSKKIKYPLPPVNKKTGSLVMNDKLLIAVSIRAEEINPKCPLEPSYKQNIIFMFAFLMDTIRHY